MQFKRIEMDWLFNFLFGYHKIITFDEYEYHFTNLLKLLHKKKTI